MATFAAGVVGVHLVMALLEKKRLENWEEKGEVCTHLDPSTSYDVFAAYQSGICCAS
jgi:hypothetical protein